MSNKKIINISQYDKLDKLIERYIFLDATIKDYELMQNAVGNQIITLLQGLNTNKRGNVRLSNKMPLTAKQISVLRDEFNNNGENTVFDSLIVNIDIEKSLDALKYENNLPEPIVKAFEIKLKNMMEIENPILVIERGDD